MRKAQVAGAVDRISSSRLALNQLMLELRHVAVAAECLDDIGTGDASGVLMNAHNGRVDHLDGNIVSSSQSVHDPGPDASPAPTDEAIVTSSIGTESLRQITPRCAGSQDPKDTIQHTAVVHTWDTAWLVRQHRLDGRHSWSVSS